MYDPITIFLIVLVLFPVGLFLLLCFLPREIALAFVVKLVWWCWTLNFCLTVKIWFLHQFWMRSLLISSNLVMISSNLGCRFFTFCTLNISLLACGVSIERSTVNHMGFPLYVTYCFSLADFNILSLCLISVSLINMCSDVFLLGFIL